MGMPLRLRVGFALLFVVLLAANVIGAVITGAAVGPLIGGLLVWLGLGVAGEALLRATGNKPQDRP